MLKVNNLCKKFDKKRKDDQKNILPPFELENISFELPTGYIMGLIGDNGAGKTVTINLILDRYIKDSGEVEILGKSACDANYKEHVGAVSGSVMSFTVLSKLYRHTNMYKKFFPNWDNERYLALLAQFKINDKMRYYKLSQGTQVKYNIALALSHNAKLLILDEPTANLDPASRIEILDIFRELVNNTETSILYSTHITSDLDKCADYITFLIDGKMQFTGEKEVLLDTHSIISGELDVLDKYKDILLGHKTNSFGFTGLALTSDIVPDTDITTARPNIEDIMVYYHKAGGTE